MNMATFLINMVKPIVGQILISLGMAVVSFAGVDTALNKLQSMVQSYFDGIPSLVANLLGLMGVGSALGIIFGALTFRLSMQGMKKISFKSS